MHRDWCKASVIMQVRHDGVMDHEGHGRGGKKWSDSGYNLKMELIV
jgi:hypothetical protein